MTNHTKFFSICCLIIGFALGALIMGPAAGTKTLPPCPTEDSTNCYWDASTHGNGQGISFIDLKGDLYYPVMDAPEFLQLPTK